MSGSACALGEAHRRWRRGLRAGVAALLLLAGILSLALLSPLTVLNGLARLSRYEATLDIPYAPGARRALDVYVPARSAAAPRPVVVFFYGGGWEEGDKGLYPFLAAALTGRGFVTVIPDYRVYPEVRFPAFIEDAALASRWVSQHIAEYGGDPNRVVLMGHSAGAQIAAMLTFNARYLETVGLEPRRDVRGLVGLAGPYDFLPLHSAVLKQIFGPESGLAATQPINFVEPGAPPAFLATGSGDQSVDPGNSARLAARIREHGGAATVRFYPRLDHRTIIGAFSPPLRVLAPVLDDVAGFIAEVTRLR